MPGSNPGTAGAAAEQRHPLGVEGMRVPDACAGPVSEVGQEGLQRLRVQVCQLLPRCKALRAERQVVADGLLPLQHFLPPTVLQHVNDEVREVLRTLEVYVPAHVELDGVQALSWRLVVEDGRPGGCPVLGELHLTAVQESREGEGLHDWGRRGGKGKHHLPHNVLAVVLLLLPAAASSSLEDPAQALPDFEPRPAAQQVGARGFGTCCRRHGVDRPAWAELAQSVPPGRVALRQVDSKHGIEALHGGALKVCQEGVLFLFLLNHLIIIII
mmetsp:Transcript_16588/g.46307  ORF Transcript_16588/g.46307 Transcript_16588/m.46307 type:complete len:271 (+) Transcript_16588:2786-3598(+)